MSGDRIRRELYGTRSCRFTRDLQEELDWQSRPFTTYYVDEDAEARDRLARLVDKPHMVPVLVENGEVTQVGYNGRGCYIQMEAPTRARPPKRA